MNCYFVRSLVLLLLGVALGVSACSDDVGEDGSGDKGNGTTESDSSTSDADATDTGSSVDTDSDDTESGASQLISTHKGWQDANCMTCHDYDEHNDGLRPGDCATCHGVNGAVEAETVPAHGGAEPKACKCHLPGKAHAPAEDFPSPESCQVCH